MVNELWSRWHVSVLLVTDAVLVPEGFLDLAFDAIHDDVRVSTVSFLCNAADFLSFPNRNHPTERAVEGHDETSTTRKLRARVPPPQPAPIPFAHGAAVLLSATALGAVGPLRESPSGHALGTIADFSLRSRRRGFIDVLDPGTFYARPADIAMDPVLVQIGAEDTAWLLNNHPFIEGFVEQQKTSTTSPVALATAAARTKVMGLRILLDGACLGPQEMGTQVALLGLVDALARRDDVAEVAVALNTEAPSYASSVLSQRKVRARQCPAVELPAVFGKVDVAHRPYQPDIIFDAMSWRRASDRFMVTVLDLIGYQIGSYHPTSADWLEYRAMLRRVTTLADGVAVISDDVRDQAVLERLPVDRERLFVTLLGTEHVTGEEPARIPDELVARGFVAGEFLFTLGTNYSHKNRDLAMRAHRVLRERGWNVALVLAGAFVPFGSSRVLESFATSDGDDVFVLPDVTSAERNWLLRHASLVLYPTSAEGFGFVPFEAARNGTPTVNVAFGPLAEIGGASPVVARDWTPEAMADAAEKLLTDPALARAQVETCLAAGSEYTWERTGEELTSVYRSLVARPPRWPNGVVPDLSQGELHA
jgi:glycosyltransferase involved in cell wall biosynthesis